MLKSIKCFWCDESGAVTVDWIVLTAAVTWLSISTLSAIGGAVQTLAERLETRVVYNPLEQ